MILAGSQIPILGSWQPAPTLISCYISLLLFGLSPRHPVGWSSTRVWTIILFRPRGRMTSIEGLEVGAQLII